MRPERVPFGSADEMACGAERAARHLRGGGIIAYPTETVYGLGCTLDREPLEWLARAKGRGPDRPFLILVRDARDVPGLAWSDEARALARVFWPGPLTLALPDPDQRYPAEVRGAHGTVAIRSSPHAGVRAILDALGAPITSTSANRPGAEPAKDPAAAAEAVIVLLGRQPGADIILLDGGALPASQPSTIVEFVGGRPRIARAGALPVERLEQVIHGIES